jgi:hypothetical protein
MQRFRSTTRWVKGVAAMPETSKSSMSQPARPEF